ncbi:MAG: isoaspartyl peptidase/L-asparaginase [Phycisphaeraceae bacterium]|nr:isoaspartyl peptidase/L-asparaginase [Phycisphaeraceae bacterium]
MPSPLMLGTWTFSTRALETAWPALAQGGRALDAAVDACAVAEEDPSVDSVGYGGLPDATGQVTLDGCVMVAPGQAGSVAGLRRHRHPVRVARMVMERTRHLMLVGDAADDFADSCGELREEVLAPEARDAWERWLARAKGDNETAARGAEVQNVKDASLGLPRPVDPGGGGGRLFAGERRWWQHDTIGVLVRDRAGSLAGACSTSGTPFKTPGRVGDSPIIGHGLYVDPTAGAAVATGTGELISSVCGTFLIVELMRSGCGAAEAVRRVLERIDNIFTLEAHHQAAFVALRADGDWAAGALRNGFLTVRRDEAGAAVVEPGEVIRDD